jgi:DNA-binding CsgD family transcriptional regulator
MAILSAEQKKRAASLTDREKEVLVLIGKGKTSKEVGKELSISPKTAEAHRNNIKSKINGSTIADLVLTAVAIGLIEAVMPDPNAVVVKGTKQGAHMMKKVEKE